MNNNSNDNNIYEIKINQEYAKLVPPLSIAEYNSLKEDIKQNGIQVPVIINQHGTILDGHHRYCVWVIDLGRPVIEMPKPTVINYDDKLQEKLFVINVNLKRRQLNSFQRICLALKIKPILQEVAKRNQKAGIKIHNTSVRNQTQVGGFDSSSGGLSRVDVQIGRYAGGIGKDTVRKVETILEKGTEGQIKNLEHGKTTINNIAKQIHDTEKRLELILLLNNNNNSSTKGSNPNLLGNNNVKLIHGDFKAIGRKTNSSRGLRDNAIATIKDNSIPLIFTDPPYERANLPLYRELGKLAARVLVPGGSLMVLSGQLYLPEAINMILEAKELRYWWSFAVIYTSECRQSIFTRKVFQEWKHLLWFVKGRKIREGFNYIADSIKSARPHKYLHEWQQSTDEIEYVIRGLTVQNEVILDPMLGSGTTAIAAIKLNRRFIGIEIEKETFNIAKSKISNFIASCSTSPTPNRTFFAGKEQKNNNTTFYCQNPI